MCEDQNLISRHVVDFYQKLYDTSNTESVDNTNLFLKGIEKDIRGIDEGFKSICDQRISLAEVQSCIGSLKDNKSPGSDGLINEFFKIFGESVAPFLVAVFEEAIDKGELPPTLRQGLIKLIPKPKKDKLSIENWRPISLLNNDAKIFAMIFAKRLKLGLDDLIGEEQSGFMPGRNICNNIRLILDMIDYNDYISDDSFVLFVDFYKAFDTISHQFMFKAIQVFGFGDRFLRAVNTLYKDCNSSVGLAHGTTPRFDIHRGIRQGCPLSPFLFLLVTEIMSLHIKKSSFKGITAVDREFKLSQLADDTAIFLANKYEVPKVVKCIETFSKVSGLKMNLSKSVLLPLRECNMSSINNIPVKSTFTYLGIVIDKNEKSRNNLNFDPIVEQITKKFNMWLMRDLSLNGRVLLSKAEGISRAVYVSLALGMPTTVFKKLDKTLFNFIWRNKCHYLKKEVLCNTRQNGGLEVLCFETVNNTFKIKWLTKLIQEEDNIWNAFPKFIFNSIGGLNFVLKCDYNPDKLPVKLANFHKQALLSWKLVYKHNFSPTNYYIWNNRSIQYKNRSLYNKNWINNGIVLVSQLMNSDGQLLLFEEFISKFDIAVTRKEYDIVFAAIPRNVLQLLIGSRTELFVTAPVNKIFLGSVDVTRNKCSSNYIRNLLVNVMVPPAKKFWTSLYKDINWKEMWLMSNKFCLNNKIKEVSFRIIHRIYPAKKTLERFKIDIEYSCTFCGSNEETIEHLFYHCVFTKMFWVDVQNFIERKTGQSLYLQEKDVLLYFEVINLEKDLIFFVQLVLFLGKFHIHKRKWTDSKPLFHLFLQELSHYSTTINDLKQSKALKTNSILEKFLCN